MIAFASEHGIITPGLLGKNDRWMWMLCLFIYCNSEIKMTWESGVPLRGHHCLISSHTINKSTILHRT